MGDASQQRRTHPFSQFCVFVSLIFATKTKDFINSPQPCHADKGGSQYIGSRNVTMSGLACQPWAENSPHKVDFTIKDNMFPDGSKEAAKNYCRNPGKQDKWGVWCYTMDPNVTWEFCHICLGDYDGYSGCVLSDKGENYMGLLTHTRSFQVCEFWKDHLDPLFKFPDGNAVNAQNFCRNPNRNAREAPWCFIAEVRGATWDYCDICKPFEGRIIPLGEVTSSTAIPHHEMSRLACLYWCISFVYCLGVVVTTNNNECWYYVKVIENPSSPQHESFNIERTCNRNTAGRNGYFLDFIGVKTEALTPLLYDASIEQCDGKCLEKFSTCLFYEYNANSKECRSWDAFCCHKEEQDDGGVLTRLLVYCNASLAATEDVQAELRAQKAKKAVHIQSFQVEKKEHKGTKTVTEKPKLEEQKTNEVKEAAEQPKLEAQTTKEAKESAENATLESQNAKEAADKQQLEAPKAEKAEPSAGENTGLEAQKEEKAVEKKRSSAIILILIGLVVMALGGDT